MPELLIGNRLGMPGIGDAKFANSLFFRGLFNCNECFLFLASKMHELNRHSRIYIAKRMEERRAVFSKQFAAVREMPSMM